MQYTFSPRLKMTSFALIGVGILIYAIGLFLNFQDQANPDFITDKIKENPQLF